MRFSAKHRLRTHTDFLQVKSSPVRIHTPAFILQSLIHPATPNALRRIGVIASKRVGNSPTRSYAKRIFRELFRKHYDQFPPCSDTVIVVRSRFNNLSFQEVESMLTKALSSINA